MWIFGQVWFACLVGFVVGAGLAWLLFARPANRKVLDLEQQLAWKEPVSTPTYYGPADEALPQSSQSPSSSQHADAEPFTSQSFSTRSFSSPSFSSQSFAPEPAAPESVGREPVVPEPNAAELTDLFEPARAVEPRTAADPDEFESDEFESGPAEPADEPAPMTAATTHQPAAEPETSFVPFDRMSGSDEQFLAYLRAEVSGTGPVAGPAAEPEPKADAAAADPEPETDPEERAAAERGALVLGDYSDEPAEYTEPEPAATADVADAGPDEPGDHHGVDDHGVNGVPHVAEATAIIPVIRDEEPASEHGVDNAVEGVEADSISGALSGDLPPAPAEEPVRPPDQTAAELTGPVSAELIKALDDARRKLDASTSATAPATAAAASDDQADDEDDWFATRSGNAIGGDLGLASEPPVPGPAADEPVSVDNTPITPEPVDPEPATSALPVREPGLSIAAITEPADEGSPAEEFDGEPALPSRSLFEPVIDPAEAPDYLPGQAHPLRVRTGFGGDDRTENHSSVPAPARAPAGAPGWQVGPFGPGSALPLPDGSAPSPQFRVKARTSSMVFHTESSPFFDRLEPQVWFRGPEDAQRAGFTSWERPRTA
jgi:hypothetical protein